MELFYFVDFGDCYYTYCINIWILQGDSVGIHIQSGAWCIGVPSRTKSLPHCGILFLGWVCGRNFFFVIRCFTHNRELRHEDGCWLLYVIDDFWSYFLILFSFLFSFFSNWENGGVPPPPNKQIDPTAEYKKGHIFVRPCKWSLNCTVENFTWVKSLFLHSQRIPTIQQGITWGVSSVGKPCRPGQWFPRWVCPRSCTWVISMKLKGFT